jgi:uncharacterized membrane protein
MKKGFIATLGALTLLALSLSLTVATTYLSINESQSALTLAEGAGALALTEGCVEDALILARRDENYSGGTAEYLSGTCVIDVTKDGTAWTLVVQGTKNTASRTVEVVLEYTAGPPGTILLTSWLER